MRALGTELPLSAAICKVVLSCHLAIMVKMGPPPEKDKVRLCSAEIKRISGHFDLETVEKLRVKGKKIDGLTILEDCNQLTWLDLSASTTTDWQLISRAKLLETLIIDRCGVSHISWLSSLKALRKLSLIDNNIDSLEKLEVLNQLTFLEELHLQKSNGTESNKVCGVSGYRNHVIELCPKLRVLDGRYLSAVNTKLHEAEEEADLLLLKKRPIDEVDVTYKAWFKPEELEWSPLVEEERGLEEAKAVIAAKAKGYAPKVADVVVGIGVGDYDTASNDIGHQERNHGKASINASRIPTLEGAEQAFQLTLAECKKLNTIGLGLNAKLQQLANPQ